MKKAILVAVFGMLAAVFSAQPAMAQLKCCGDTYTYSGESVARAWGYNPYGQLGDGTTTNRTTPVGVRNLSGVKAISASYDHSLAVKEDGTVWAWGRNYYGELGNGTNTDSLAPVQVKNLSGVKAVATG